MNKCVAVIGGGVAGMAAAEALASMGIRVILYERDDDAGGHVGQWDRLFPNRRPAGEVVAALRGGLKEGVELMPGCLVTGVQREDEKFRILTEHGPPGTVEAVVLATGFDLFDARRKEEYGYGIYDNVITSADLERIFREGKGVVAPSGRIPKRIAFIHCVGSRDEKAGNLYCSKVCCVTGVKQAIEVRELLPSCEVWSFYMDLRMFDRHFEEMYLEAQKKWGVNFIRGRLSECAENPDLSLVIKTEDTLTGKPLRMTVDLLVLLAGFIPGKGTAGLSDTLGLEPGEDGFLLPADLHLPDYRTRVPGVFLAGAVKGPCSISQAVAEARSAAVQVREYLEKDSEIAK